MAGVALGKADKFSYPPRNMGRYTCESCGRDFYNTSSRIQSKCGRCQRTRKLGEFW